jgi:Acyl-protein synthetase, LuxE
VQPDRRDLAGLLVAARLWAGRRPVDDERVRQARDAVLLANHRRYLASVPAYARLATEIGHVDVDDVGTLVDELLVGVGLFKSYDDALLERGDFAGLTAWTAEVSTLDPAPRLDGVTGLDGWRARMQEAGVSVMVSSGTSGRPSLVPRDAATVGALSSNGRCYSTLAWGGYADGRADFDCLLIVRPGTAQGLHVVAGGLGQLARRTVVVDPGGPDAGVSLSDRAAAAELVRDAGRDGRRLLVFGGPAGVAQFCGAVLDTGGRLPLPPGALLVTGGGWKAGTPRRDFARLVDDVLAVGPDQIVDVYGMAECNAYLIRCAAGRYHVPPVLDAAVVDAGLRSLPGADATGLIALLDPFAFSYPGFLLTGDRGRLVREPCPCGLSGPGFVGEITRAPGREAKGCAGAGAGVLA